MTGYPDYAAAERAAYELLLRHGQTLPVRPMFLLREAARILSYDEAEEQLGLSAAEFERQYGRADAFTVRRGGECLVCCRMDGNPARLNFTLAHELGHIVLRHDGTSPAEEREADHFASCLLCPEPVRRRLLARTDLAVEDAAALCYLSVAAVQMAMRRRPTAADDALLGRIDALFAEQADAAKPDFSGISRHSLQNSRRFAKKS